MAKDKLAKREETGLANWDAELAKYAQEVSDKEQMPGGSFISFKSGRISIAGSPIKDDTLNVVILDFIYENACYEGSYDSENPQPPVCFAFARDSESLKPHENSSSPKCEQCEGCPANEFGSAEQGKGKACKNVRRLAVISANGLSPESIRDSEVMYIKIPVTSVKGWSHYVKSLAATMRRPPFGVVTEVGVVPDPKSQFKVTFKVVEALSGSLGAAVMARRAEIAEQIAFPYPKASEREAAKPAAKKSRRF